MNSFFGVDVTNRILHELEYTLPSAYLGIDIAMSSMSSIADGLLLIYLSEKSPVDTKHAGLLSTLAMILAVVIYWLTSVTTKGTDIWNLITQISPSSGKDNGNDSKDWMSTSLRISQDLSSTASGMLLLFAIGFALFTITFIRRLPKTHYSHSRLSSSVRALAASFVVRNAVRFAFFLTYSQYKHVASLGVQLVYMILNGILSVAIYLCIVLIAAAQDGETSLVHNPEYGKVQQTSITEGVGWQPGKPSVPVGTNAYESSYRNPHSSPYAMTGMQNA